MNESQLEDLQNRIERLERDNRRLKVRALAAVILTFAAIAILGHEVLTPNRTVRAKQLILLDEDGNASIELAAGPTGPVLALHGPEGTDVMLIAGEEGSGLLIEDPEGPDISLLAGSAPYLFFGDAGGGGPVAMLGISPSEGPRLQLKYSDGIWLVGPRLVNKDLNGNVIWEP